MGLGLSARRMEARRPLLISHADMADMGNTDSASPAEEVVTGVPLLGNPSCESDCAICLSALERASTLRLPACGHTFHTLCLASALQHSMLCPLCRAEVKDPVCNDVAQRLMADSPQESASSLAAELLMDLRARESGSSSSSDQHQSPEETADAIRRAVRLGDASKVPAIASLLGVGMKPSQKPHPVVRLAAVESLRSIVPALHNFWPGWPHVRQLLRDVCTGDDNFEVQKAAVTALKDVGSRGDEEDLTTIAQVLEESADSDVRILAADVLKALGVAGDRCSLRVATIALGDRDASVRSTALSTLRCICGSRGECPELVGELASLISGHELPEVRAAALEIVAQAEALDGPYGIGVASNALRDQSEEVTAAALTTLRKLWNHKHPQAVETLKDLLLPGNAQSKDAVLRCNACVVLQNIAVRGNADAAAVAVKAMADDDDSVRTAAAQALKQLAEHGDIEVTTALLGLTQHSDVGVQTLAVELLGNVARAGDNQVSPRLQELKKTHDDTLQMTAEMALKQLR